MEPKIIYENEDKNEEILPIDNKKSTFKNSSIEGSGSESLLNSIHSQPQEINHSSLSSLNAIGKSNNSINNSNDINGKLNLTNDQNSSFNISVNPQNNNNNNHFDLIDSKLSNINNLDLGDSKEGISSINNLLNNDNNNINKTNFLDYSIISNNNIIDNNKSKINKSDSNEEKKEGSLNNKSKSNISKGKEDSDKSLNDIFKIEVKEKMKQGFIPFFMKAKGYNAVFYYGKPNSKLGIVIEHYIKKIDGSNEIKPSFYYNNKLIDFDSTIGQIKIKPLTVISNEIK